MNIVVRMMKVMEFFLLERSNVWRAVLLIYKIYISFLDAKIMLVKVKKIIEKVRSEKKEEKR
jgi:hypothetical protein